MASKARTEAAILASIPVVPMPVDLSDETQFPELARARRHYAIEHVDPARGHRLG